MKLIDLTIPLGIATPPWPTYEPLQVKYFKRLAPNGANGQLLTHSNHLGTHLDGEIHFYTPGKDIASLDLNDFLVGPGVVVDLSDIAGDYAAIVLAWQVRRPRPPLRGRISRLVMSVLLPHVVGGALAAPRLPAFGGLRDQGATYAGHRQLADAGWRTCT